MRRVSCTAAAARESGITCRGTHGLSSHCARARACATGFGSGTGFGTVAGKAATCCLNWWTNGETGNAEKGGGGGIAPSRGRRRRQARHPERTQRSNGRATARWGAYSCAGSVAAEEGSIHAWEGSGGGSCSSGR
jgi:hypothetical protein